MFCTPPPSVFKISGELQSSDDDESIPGSFIPAFHYLPSRISPLAWHCVALEPHPQDSFLRTLEQRPCAPATYLSSFPSTERLRKKSDHDLISSADASHPISMYVSVSQSVSQRLRPPPRRPVFIRRKKKFPQSYIIRSSGGCFILISTISSRRGDLNGEILCTEERRNWGVETDVLQ